MLTSVWLLFNRFPTSGGVWGGGTHPLVFCFAAARQCSRGLCLMNVHQGMLRAGGAACWSLLNCSWLLAQVRSGFCHLLALEIWAVCPAPLLKEVIMKMQSGQWRWSTSRRCGSGPRAGSPTPVKLHSWMLRAAGGAQTSCPPASRLYQSTTSPTQLSCSHTTSFAPDIFCCKAGMLRAWIMVIQIEKPEFKEKAFGHLKYPKTQRLKPFAVELTRVWSCCVRYPAVAPLYVLFWHSHCNTSFPKGGLNVHTFEIQCIK